MKLKGTCMLSDWRGSRERMTLATGWESWEEAWFCHDLATTNGHFINQTDLSAFAVSKLPLPFPWLLWSSSISLVFAFSFFSGSASEWLSSFLLLSIGVNNNNVIMSCAFLTTVVSEDSNWNAEEGLDQTRPNRSTINAYNIHKTATYSQNSRYLYTCRTMIA